ncbi:MAG: hypothetical protein FWG18_01610, partial [Alphaproteobacteria bacterium]|nr:hypothetical protein [Alphaproteobacteria bacterium]
MKYRTLNIIGIIAVMLAVIFAFYLKGCCMKTNLGYFPENALENAVPRVNAALGKARADIENLVARTDITYMNFARALMDIDAELDVIVSPISHLDSVNHSEETRKIMAEIIAPLSEFSSDMSRHHGIYKGYLYIKKNEYNSLTPSQKKFVDDVIRNFEIAGVNLPKPEQARLKKISTELSKLSNDFKNNVIAANQKFKLTITDE